METLLHKLHQNLNILLEREAKHAGEAPPALLNQIDDHRVAIGYVEQAQRGELSRADLEAALQPLLVDIGRRSGEAAVSIGDIGGDLTGVVIAGGDVRDVTINVIRPEQRPTHIPFQAPGLPLHFVARRDLAPLKAALLAGTNRPLALTALHGMGGLGKTTAAGALAHDADLLARFADGVLWATLGPGATTGVIETRQASWGRALGDDLRSAVDPEAKAARLRTLLRDKRCLLIVDDAWPGTVDLRPLLVGGPRCRTLITTRHHQLARKYAQAHRLNLLSPADALELLHGWWGRQPSPNPSHREGDDSASPPVGGRACPAVSGIEGKPDSTAPLRETAGGQNPAAELVHRLGYLPLAVTLAGAQLADGATPPELLAAFRRRQGDLAALDMEDPQAKEDSLTLAFDLSFERLKPADQHRLAQLSVFAANEPFAAAAAAAVWGMLPSPQPSGEETASRPSGRGGKSSPPSGGRACPAVSGIEGGRDDAGQTITTTRKHLRLLARHALLEKESGAGDQETGNSGQPSAVNHSSFTIHHSPFYLLHPLIRAYARTHLSPADHASAAERHTAHYLAVAERSSDDWRSAEAALGQIRHAWERVVRDADLSSHVIPRGVSDEESPAESHSRKDAGVQGSGGDDPPPTTRTAQLFNFIGAMTTFHERRGLWNVDIEWHQTGLTAARQSDNRQKEAVYLNNIGYTHRLLGNWDVALDHFKQALAAFQELGDRASSAVLLNNIGQIFKQRGDLNQALDHYNQALAANREIGNKAQVAINLNNIGRIFQQRGDLDQALDNYNQALAANREIGNKAQVAINLNNIGQIFQQRGDLDQALDYCRQALAINRELGDKAKIAIRLNNIGLIFQQRGDLDQALDHYQQALAIGREMGNKAAVAIRLNNIGLIFKQRGDLDLALDHYQQALAIQQSMGDKAGVAIDLNNIGRIFKQRGDLDQALDHYNQALAIDRELGDKAGLAIDLNNIGLIFKQRGDLDLALDHYNQALAANREIGNKAQVAINLNNIGLIFKQRGDLDLALDHYNQALAIQQSMGDKAGVAIDLNNIGAVYIEQKRFAEAEAVLAEAVALFEQLDSPNAARAREWLEKARRGEH